MKKLTKIMSEVFYLVVFYTALVAYTIGYKVQHLFSRKKEK